MMKAAFLAVLGVVAVVAIAPTVSSFVTGTEGEKSPARAADIRGLQWKDLTPPLSAEAEQAAAELNLRIDQMTENEITVAMDLIEAEGNVLITDMDDTNIELEGYLVPIDFDAQTVTDFVLVPWFGACMHVPPPPPNQIAFVKYREGIAMSDIEENFYTPFKVRGKIKVGHATTELAEVGYQITASDVVMGQQE
jgi:hypothetical protein